MHLVYVKSVMRLISFGCGGGGILDLMHHFERRSFKAASIYTASGVGARTQWEQVAWHLPLQFFALPARVRRPIMISTTDPACVFFLPKLVWACRNVLERTSPGQCLTCRLFFDSLIASSSAASHDVLVIRSWPLLRSWIDS
jgi:hypothetical protein